MFDIRRGPQGLSEVSNSDYASFGSAKSPFMVMWEGCSDESFLVHKQCKETESYDDSSKYNGWNNAKKSFYY